MTEISQEAVEWPPIFFARFEWKPDHLMRVSDDPKGRKQHEDAEDIEVEEFVAKTEVEHQVEQAQAQVLAGVREELKDEAVVRRAWELCPDPKKKIEGLTWGDQFKATLDLAFEALATLNPSGQEGDDAR